MSETRDPNAVPDRVDADGDAPPDRAGPELDRAEAGLDRAEAAPDRVDAAVDRADAAPYRAGAAPPASEALLLLDEGLRRFEQQDVDAAHAHFERAHRRAGSDPRVMSWYGVTLVLVEKNSNLGMLYCDQALRLAGPSPELLLNQARAYLALHQRERAVRAIQRGISGWPEHPALRLAQDAMGWRRRPVLPCFARSNPLNRWLGKLRHRWHKHRSPPPAMSPITLGVLPPEQRSE